MLPREGSHWGGACARVRFPTFFAREYPPMRIERLLLLAASLSTLLLVSCQSPAPTPLSPPPAPSTSDGGTNPVATAMALPTATAYAVQHTLTPVPSPTAYPTATPYADHPTYTPQPTFTPLPTATPYAEATEYPPQPTLTPAPTPTEYPTSTPYPRSPTNTPRPTHTPFPTSTPYPTPRVPSHRIAFVGGMQNHRTAFWQDRSQTLLVGCRTNAPADVKNGKSWYTFSSDGKFNSSRFMVSVTGFPATSAPSVGTCYEMVVRFEGNAEFCYWLRSLYTPPRLLGSPCSGWEQVTPEFKLASATSAYRITRLSERWKYLADSAGG